MRTRPKAGTRTAGPLSLDLSARPTHARLEHPSDSTADSADSVDPVDPVDFVRRALSRRDLFRYAATAGAVCLAPRFASGLAGGGTNTAALTAARTTARSKASPLASLPTNHGHTPWFGARKPPIGEYSDWPSLQEAIGSIQIGRVFYTGGAQTLPPTYDPEADYDDARGGPQVVSYNIGSVNTAPWCESVTVPTWLSISHEPENNKFADGQAFVDHYTTEVDIIRSVGNPLISVGPLSMAYAYRSNGGNGLDGSYLPPVEYCDWYGVDVYQQLPNYNLPDFDYWKNWYALVANRGKPILIGEMGIYAEPNQYSGGTIDPALQAKRALLIPQYFNYLRGLGNVICALWWCTPGKPGEPGNYMPSDQASLKALQGIPRAN